jgi:hypothetical protein
MAIIMPVYSPIAQPVRRWLVALMASRLDPRHEPPARCGAPFCLARSRSVLLLSRSHRPAHRRHQLTGELLRAVVRGGATTQCLPRSSSRPIATLSSRPGWRRSGPRCRWSNDLLDHSFDPAHLALMRRTRLSSSCLARRIARLRLGGGCRLPSLVRLALSIPPGGYARVVAMSPLTPHLLQRFRSVGAGGCGRCSAARGAHRR